MAVLYWDPSQTASGTTAAAIVGAGGSGSWDTNSAVWYNPLTNTDVVWDNADGDTAAFTGTAGTVTVASGISAGEVDFATTAYTLAGGSLAISGSGAIDVGAGLTDAISSDLNGADGLTKTSDGTLLLSGANDFSGATNVSAGRLTLQDVALASSSIAVGSGATLEYNDTSGNVVQAATTLTGAGKLQKTGGGTLTFGSQGTINWNFGSGALIDVEGGTLVGGSYIQDVWTNDLAALNIASGATFNGVEANVQVDALTGSGTFAGGYSGAGYSADTIGVNNGSGAFSGVIQDATAPLNLIKTGTGTETLAGTNSYTGGTTVSAGNLTVQDGILASGNLAIASGATFDFDITSGSLRQTGLNLSGAGTLKKDGAGTLIFGGAGAVNWNLSGGALIDVEGGTLVGGSYIQDVWTNNLASLNIASGATFNGVEANVQVDALTGSGTFAGGYPGAGYSADTIGVNGGSGTFSGTIEDGTAAMNLVKAGAGTEILSGAVSYSGSTTIDGGRLTLQDVRLESSGVSIAFAGTLEFDDTAGTLIQGSLSLSGTGMLQKTGGGTLIFGSYGPVNWDFGSGALIDVEGGTLVGGNSVQDNWSSDMASLNIASGAAFDGVEANVQVDALTGAGTFAGGWAGAGYAADTIGVSGGSGTFSGVIQDSSAPMNLVLAGAGTEILTGANTYTGTTTINAGTLQLGDGDSSNGSIAGDIVNNAALEFDNPVAQTYSGSISGAGIVTVNGPGALILTGPNDYTGTTTVNEGTLEVDTYIMPSAVTVNPGGTLQGTGGTGTVTNNGGTEVAGYYYVQLTDTTLQRGDTADTNTGTASISVSPTQAIYAMSAAQAVFQVVSGTTTNTDTGDTHPISTAAIANAGGHPAFIYSPSGYNDDNDGAFQNIGQAIMFEDSTGLPGCDYDYNDGYFRVTVKAAPTLDALDDANNDGAINQADEAVKDTGAGDVILVSNESVAGQTHTAASHLDDVQVTLSAIDQALSSTRNWSGWNLTLTADDSNGAATSAVGVWSINGATEFDNGAGVANLNSYLAALPDTFNIGVSAAVVGTYELKFILKDATGSTVATDQVRVTTVAADAKAALTVTNMAPLSFSQQDILNQVTLPNGFIPTSAAFSDTRGGDITVNADGTFTYSPHDADRNDSPWDPYNPYGTDSTGADGAHGGASFTMVFTDAAGHTISVAVVLDDAHSGYQFFHLGDWVDSPVVGAGGLLLVGGGQEENLGVEPAFQWFVNQAGLGDIVIIANGQGQRPLTLCAGKDLCHEIEIPAATSAFHDDAFFAGMLLEQR